MLLRKNIRLKLLIVAVFVVILSLPALINWLILQPSIVRYVGKDVDWLMFWGSYIGAIISAGSAFVILYIQRMDNEMQNEQNREDNKRENGDNRLLQINVLKYQQQSHWLDNFKTASLDYCHTFNSNDVIMVVNIMWDSPKDAFELLKSLYNRLISAEARFSFVRKHDDLTDNMVKEIVKVHMSYKQIIDDLQYILLYFIATIPAARNKIGFSSFLQMHNYVVSAQMRTLLSQQITSNVDNRSYFNSMYLDISKGIELYEQYVRDLLYEYIKQEQVNIDGLLTENFK